MGLEIFGEAVEIVNAEDETEEHAAPVRALAIAGVLEADHPRHRLAQPRAEESTSEWIRLAYDLRESARIVWEKYRHYRDDGALS